MKPAAFEYYRPETIEEAVELLQRFEPDAKVLAGGQSLVPLMNFRLAQPGCLVDIGRIQELSAVGRENGTVAIGAAVRQSSIEDSPLLRTECPLLVEATGFIGHRTIRNRGTIGGSLAHADPSAEYPAVFLALDGEVKAVSAAGERWISASDFFLTVCTTTLAPDELITEVRLPVHSPRTGWAFVELSRRHGDYAVVGVAATVVLDRTGVCEEARIAIAGSGQTPLRCYDAESDLKGVNPTPEVIREIAETCATMADPLDDLHASASYRRAMIGVYVERALENAVLRAGSGDNET